MADTENGPGKGAANSSADTDSTVLSLVKELRALGQDPELKPGGAWGDQWVTVCPLPHESETRWYLDTSHCLGRVHTKEAMLDKFQDIKQKNKTTEESATKPEALDWSTFLASDLGAVDWLAGQLMEKGQQMSLIGAGKVGKSLLTLEWAVAMSAGYSFLGDEEREPVRVMYLDQENSPRDLQRRIRALGYKADELKNLDYLSFPAVGPLDMKDGASALIARVDHYKPQVVILDTVSRFISGKENDADTWIALYNTSLKILKGRGVSVLRLDHFGKDTDRGGRGSSAKTQDIDHVWELTEQGGNTFRLRRTFTRSGMGPDDLMLTRHGAPGEDGTTWHEVRTGTPKPFEGLAAQAAAKALDLAGIPIDYGRDRAKKEGPALGIKEKGNAFWGDVVGIRKKPGYIPWNL